MNEYRLIWEPEFSSKGAVVSKQFSKYMDNAKMFAYFPNGTCLVLKDAPDLDLVINGAMKEARRLPDFEVFEMEDRDYLVSFANPLMVYVGKEEFEECKEEIQIRFKDLHFPSESLMPLGGKVKPEHVLIGLYARGKLQRDAWSAPSYKIVQPLPTGSGVKSFNIR
jgi:hypothetical protein